MRGNHSSAKAAVIRLQLHPHEFVAIEVDELDPPVREMRFQVRGLHHKFGVALMAWTLSDHDSGRAQTKETTGGRSDNVRVRVYRTRQVLHQIWFEKNRLAKPRSNGTAAIRP